MRHLAVPTATALVLLAACSAPGSSVAPAAPGTAGFARAIPAVPARFVFRIHHRSRARFISPSTSQIAVSVTRSTGGSPVFQSTIQVSNPKLCKAVSGSTVCTVEASLPPGAYDATMSASDAHGVPLSAATDVPFEVKAGGANQVSCVLDGIAHALTLAAGSSTIAGSAAAGFTASGSSAATLVANAKDADGNTIVGPGSPSFRLEVVSGTGWSTATPPPSAPNRLTLTPPDANGSIAQMKLVAISGGAACEQSGAVCSLAFSVQNVVGPVGDGKLAFRINVTAAGNTTANIWTMNPDGSDLTQLTFGQWNDQPNYSFDGTKIVYTEEPTYNAPTSEIAIMNADGSGQTPLTAFADEDSVPSFSPDGTKIAFRRDSNVGKQIWTMNVDGSDQTYLGIDGKNPVYSADGKEIAYAGNSGDIWVANSDGSDPHAITNLSGTIYAAAEPAWSPDGTEISYSVVDTSNGTTNIWLMNADGTNEHQLTHDTLDIESNWAPDSSKVVFDDWSGSGSTAVAHLGAIDRDGTNETDLTPSIPNSGIEPAWQPLPAPALRRR